MFRHVRLPATPAARLVVLAGFAVASATGPTVAAAPGDGVIIQGPCYSDPCKQKQKEKAEAEAHAAEWERRERKFRRARIAAEEERLGPGRASDAARLVDRRIAAEAAAGLSQVPPAAGETAKPTVCTSPRRVVKTFGVGDSAQYAAKSLSLGLSKGCTAAVGACTDISIIAPYFKCSGTITCAPIEFKCFPASRQ